MAQQIRGDVTLTIDGEEYTIKPSFEAYDAIEAATGLGLLETMQAVAALRISVITKVLVGALQLSGYTVKRAEIGAAIMQSLSDPDQPLIKAAIEFLNAYFPKSQVSEGKKPSKTKAPAAR